MLNFFVLDLIFLLMIFIQLLAMPFSVIKPAISLNTNSLENLHIIHFNVRKRLFIQIYFPKRKENTRSET